MDINEFFVLKTKYKNIAIDSMLFSALMILLFEIEIFAFWGIFGEGASASRISEIWFVEIILDYLPITIVGGFLFFKIIKTHKNQKYIESKTNIIILSILVLLFLFRDKILSLLF